MAVGFLVDCFFYELGNGDFVHSFFSTISYHLEPKGWGTKYPYLLKDLYNNKLSWHDVDKACEEAKIIESKLKKLRPEMIIWDIEDISQSPPWGSRISPKVTNLANYFATSEGKTFFEILNTALQVSEEEKSDIIIRKL